MLFHLAHTAHLNGMRVVGPCPTITRPGEESLETSCWREKTYRVSVCRVHQVGSVCVQYMWNAHIHASYPSGESRHILVDCCDVERCIWKTKMILFTTNCQTHLFSVKQAFHVQFFLDPADDRKAFLVCYHIKHNALTEQMASYFTQSCMALKNSA